MTTIQSETVPRHPFSPKKDKAGGSSLRPKAMAQTTRYVTRKPQSLGNIAERKKKVDPKDHNDDDNNKLFSMEMAQNDSPTQSNRNIEDEDLKNNHKTISLKKFDPLLASKDTGSSSESNQHPFSSLANELLKISLTMSESGTSSHPSAANQTPLSIHVPLDISINDEKECLKTPKPTRDHNKSRIMAGLWGRKPSNPKNTTYSSNNPMTIDNCKKDSLTPPCTPTTIAEDLDSPLTESSRKKASKTWRQMYDDKRTSMVKNTKRTYSVENFKEAEQSQISPLIQELMDAQSPQENDESQSNMRRKINLKEAPSQLFIPTLVLPVKPQQVTSFLITGQEAIIRSSEQDATDWQLDIPSLGEFKACAKLCQFMNSYRSVAGPIDLKSFIGISRYDLLMFAKGENMRGQSSRSTFQKLKDYSRPTIELLLEQGADMIQVAGYVQSESVHSVDPDHRREILIVERQRQFLCIVRGTVAEQQGKVRNFVLAPGASGSFKPKTTKIAHVTNDSNNNTVTLLSDPYAAFVEMQPKLFAILDKLAEQNPFYDVTFTGHGYGAALATIAAFGYANTRPSIRVSAILTNQHYKVGMEDFRFAVHSSPNLKVMRVEMGWPVRSKPLGIGKHVGHLIRINDSGSSSSPLAEKIISSSTKGEPSEQKQLESETHYQSKCHDNQQFLTKAYKFGVDPTKGKQKRQKFLSKPKEKEIVDYVNAFDSLNETNWVTTYYKEDGVGVRGRDNETRQMI